jgi:hypothetical protein
MMKPRVRSAAVDLSPESVKSEWLATEIAEASA